MSFRKSAFKKLSTICVSSCLQKMIMWSWETWGENMSNINFSEAPRVLVVNSVVSWFTPNQRLNRTYKTNQQAIDPIESDSIHLSWKCPNDSNLTSPLVDQSFPRSSCQVEWESIILLVVARKCPWIIHSYKLLASYHWLFSVCIHLVHTYYLCSFINVIYLHIRILMYLYTHLNINVNVNIDALPKTNIAPDFLPPHN